MTEFDPDRDTGWFVRDDLRFMLFPGPKGAEVLNGLVTNEVTALAAGQGCYAVALTPKGKIIADLTILRRHDDLLVMVPAAAWNGWADMVRKYVNPRLTRYADVTGEWVRVDVIGPGAMELEAGDTAGAASYRHGSSPIGEGTGILAVVPDFGRPTRAVISDRAAQRAVEDALAARGFRAVTPAVAEFLRVEAGRPLWGIDMDDTMLAQEANMDELGAISYTKGCYTGQETVARLHFRGHVNKLLRGLQLDGDVLPPRGATLHREDGAAAGDTRSSVHSPRLGTIALAMVRREVEPGTTLTAQWEGGSARAVVTPLPFPAAR